MARTELLKNLTSISITDGTHQTPTYAKSGYIFLSSKNVTSGVIDWDNVMYISEDLHKELNKRVSPKKDDILLAKNGTTGVAAIVDRDAIFDIYVSLALIRPDKSKVLPRFLFHAINSPQSKRFFDSHLKGIGVPNLHLTHIRELPIRLPSFEDQSKIVMILDKTDHLISLRKQQLAKLDELIKARFVEMFGDPVVNPHNWDKKAFLEMGTCKNGMNFHYNDAGITIHCLGVGDFQNYSIISDTSALPLISLNEFPSEDYLLNDDDIVFVRSNGNKALVGRSVAVYPGNTPTTFSGFCIRFRNRDKSILTPYLLQVLKSDSMRKKMAGRGANIQNLNQQILGSLEIPTPPVTLQEQFSKLINQIDKSKAVVRQSLDKLETLKNALMQEYFG